jgi:hypothetical protein
LKSEALNIHLVVVPSRVADCAAELQTRLPPDQWATLCSLAAEVVSRHEARAGSLVLVVPQNRQTAEIARALGAPGLDRAVAKLAGRA